MMRHYFLKIVNNSYFLFYGVLVVLGSFLGWVVEIPYKTKITGNCHASFMYGPFNPLYGFAICFVGFFFLCFNKLFHKIFLSYNKTFWGINSYQKIFIDFLLIFLLWLSFCMMETLTGLFLLHFGIRLWDYSYHSNNFYGVIAENPARVWFKCSIIVYFLFPSLLIRFRQTCEWLAANETRFRFLKYLLIFFIIIFIFDFFFSSVVLFSSSQNTRC